MISAKTDGLIIILFGGRVVGPSNCMHIGVICQIRPYAAAMRPYVRLLDHLLTLLLDFSLRYYDAVEIS